MATIDLSQTGGKRAAPRDWLRLSATFCFLSIAAGQLLFTAFILLFYYPPSLSGDFAAWNAKPLIKGFVPGDPGGNLFFAAHVLMAAVITFGGLVQLVPAIRGRWPVIHRWNGRLYLLSALVLALGGLWLTWVRVTWLHWAGAVGISLDALLILLFGALAWRDARARRFAAHTAWRGLRVLACHVHGLGHAGTARSWVRATSWSSLALAAPLAMAARAWAIPSWMEATTLPAYRAAPAFRHTMSCAGPGVPASTSSSI